jgi:hypothetical protein
VPAQPGGSVNTESVAVSTSSKLRDVTRSGSLASCLASTGATTSVAAEPLPAGGAGLRSNASTTNTAPS